MLGPSGTRILGDTPRITGLLVVLRTYALDVLQEARRRTLTETAGSAAGAPELTAGRYGRYTALGRLPHPRCALGSGPPRLRGEDALLPGRAISTDFDL